MRLGSSRRAEPPTRTREAGEISHTRSPSRAIDAMVREERSSVNLNEMATCIHEVTRAVMHRIHSPLQAERLSFGQFSVLHIVSSLPGTSVSTVARHLSANEPNVSVIVSRLVAAGLVRRQRSMRDLRAVELSITPKGRRVESRVWRAIGRAVVKAAEGMSREEVATALGVLGELSQRLDPTHSPDQENA